MIGKTLLPNTLFGRALLILLLPTLLIQAVMLYIFFERHWDSVTRNMAKTLASEAIFLVTQLKGYPAGEIPPAVFDFDKVTDVSVKLDAIETFEEKRPQQNFPELRDLLSASINEPFRIEKQDGNIEIRILLPNQVLKITVSAKRLESPTTVILVLWMLGTTTVFLLIAGIFLRNQIRPIRKLARAADDFGRGVDMPDFKPSGASEVRTAARAFITMRERIKRQLRTRTDMLAGISHDLRTPLTRMKLQLAMLEGREEAKELAEDVQQMEHMIEEYLDFARGDTREDTDRVSLKDLLEDIVADYQRSQAYVTLAAPQDVTADVRVMLFRRMLHNLIDNAVRYGKRCKVALKALPNACEIVIDDEGSGIPADKYDEVFQPFRRLEESRNVKTGGAGLGLTIARDAALAHGGSISLASAPTGGLRVIVRLPLTKEGA